jgi:hypothetical protein
MKRRIVPLLSTIITVTLFLSCALPADDEIRLISPKDGAILHTDDLSKDTCLQRQLITYYICAIVPLRWEACPDTAIGFYEIVVYDTANNQSQGRGQFPADSTLCYSFRIVVEIGRIDEDDSLIPDTTASTNIEMRPFPQFYDWRVDGYRYPHNLDRYWSIAESEIWGFTVVKE